MIDIEKLKQSALISNGEPMLISASEIIELIARLEAAELFAERTAKAESTLINDLSDYVSILEAQLQTAENEIKRLEWVIGLHPAIDLAVISMREKTK